jgi:uncharacterized protein
MSDEYRALVEKVESFTGPTYERRRADMQCHRGCDGCCHAWLTVSPVEAAPLQRALSALPRALRSAIAARGRRELEREAQGETPARCALLDEHGACEVYEDRPLVCRTQGHALRYPAGFIPVEAVRARVSTGELAYCPLNYTDAPPRAPDVLDAERVDALLAVVNLRYARAHDLAPEQRQPISALAAEADMLGCESLK